jgi:hypothetical protein
MQYHFADSGAMAILIRENFAARPEKFIGTTSLEMVIKMGRFHGFRFHPLAKKVY